MYINIYRFVCAFAFALAGGVRYLLLYRLDGWMEGRKEGRQEERKYQISKLKIGTFTLGGKSQSVPASYFLLSCLRSLDRSSTFLVLHNAVYRNRNRNRTFLCVCVRVCMLPWMILIALSD